MSARPILQALANKDYELLKELGINISIYEQDKALAMIKKNKLPNNEYKISLRIEGNYDSIEFYVVAKSEDDVRDFVCGSLDWDDFGEKIMAGADKSSLVSAIEEDYCSSVCCEVEMESCEQTDWEHFDKEDYAPLNNRTEEVVEA